VIKEDGQYRLLATADSLENVGKLVLDLVRSNDLESAQKWLDLVINGTFLRPGQNPGPVTVNVLGAGPSGDDSPAARFLWSGLTEKGRTAAAIRITASSLIGTFSASEEAIRILKQERQAATNRGDRGNIDLALCQAYVKASKWTELLATAKDLKASYAVSHKSFAYLIKARTGLRQWAELEQDARTELKTSPENAQALRAAALAMMRAGKPEKATEYIDQIRKLQFSGKEEHVLAAWHSVLSRKPDDKLIEQLEHDRGTDIMEPDLSYILGFLQSQAGKTDEARRALASALELEDWVLLDAKAWVLQGKVQEQFGNVDSAAAAYSEAKKRIADGDESAWALKLVPMGAKP
jgi:tetratricopeptide (TPR) repeat protein